jgi:hypothetical protein
METVPVRIDKESSQNGGISVSECSAVNEEEIV